ncbi:MAG TPA: acyl-CoA dehydrogenase family protein [Myxococcota bacterium]|nr:acyl-CoA dehydrogenase family protein [Myxococcota bacterium]
MLPRPTGQAKRGCAARLDGAKLWQVKALLDRLLREQPYAGDVANAAAWWGVLRGLLAGVAAPLDRAIVGGFHADRLGYAFLGGYHAALRVLVPSLPDGALVAMAASEQGGVHPRAIETSLVADGEAGWRMSGRKTFATLAPDAEHFLVIAGAAPVAPQSEAAPHGSASAQERDGVGRHRLRALVVEAHRPGIHVTPLPPTPFAPEIRHASIELDNVRVAAADLLPGDGYDRYLKPFRTIEDLHVLGASVGYLLGAARRYDWPRETAEEGCALAAAVRGLAPALEEPLAPALHVALAGVLGTVRPWADRCAPLWAGADPGARARWERDRPLLEVAERARNARRAAAWGALGRL